MPRVGNWVKGENMKKNLWYMAHPVAPYDGVTIEENLRRAKCYLRALNRAGEYVIAPWIGLVESLDDDDQDDKLHGFQVDLECLRRCDGIVLCGPKVSDGMRLELQEAKECGLKVVDATWLPPRFVDGLLPSKAPLPGVVWHK